MAQLDEDILLPEIDWDARDENGRIDFKAATKAQNEAFAELAERSRNLLEGEIVGALLHWPVGDGRAFYVVTSKDPLRVSWVGVGDNWQVDPILIKGLDVDDVRRMIDDERRMRELFNKEGA